MAVAAAVQRATSSVSPASLSSRLFGASSTTSSSSSSPTLDFARPPLSVAWEDRDSSLAGLPGLSVFGAHLSSRWLVALAVATAAAGPKGLLIAFAVWVLFKLGFEGGGEGAGRNGGAVGPGGHRLGAHPHSGALPARALASYLAAAGGARAAAAAAGTPATAAAAGGAGGGTVGGSAGAAFSPSSAAAKKGPSEEEDVRNATRKAWAAREAAVAAAKAAAAAANEGKG